MQSVNRAREFAATLQAECLGVRVSRLQRLISRHFAQALRPHRLTIPQMEILAVLTMHGVPLKPAFMADQLAVERSTLSRNLALLTECGWITAHETSPSGRFMAVTITLAGTKKLTGARAAWGAAQTTVRRLLGTDALGTLDTWLSGLQGASEDPDRLSLPRRRGSRHG